MPSFRKFLRTLIFGWQLHNLLSYFASFGPNLDIFNYFFRPGLLRLAGATIGRHVSIMPRVQVTPGELEIGDEVFINSDCRFACGGGIQIGDYCQIGNRVSLETIDHQLMPVVGGKRPSEPAPIHVEDHVWIGSGAIVLPGVTIGEGAVVAAGAVVTKDVSAFTVVGGVPAKLLRRLPVNERQEEKHREAKRPSSPSHYPYHSFQHH